MTVGHTQSEDHERDLHKINSIQFVEFQGRDEKYEEDYEALKGTQNTHHNKADVEAYLRYSRTERTAGTFNLVAHEREKRDVDEISCL